MQPKRNRCGNRELDNNIAVKITNSKEDNISTTGRKKFVLTDALLFSAHLFVGGFHEYISCALTVVMCTYLLARIQKEKKLNIRKDILTSAVVAVCLGYGITCFWAIDRGMAFIGFLKFLPLLLYLFCLQQEDNTGQALTILPYLGAAMTVISAIGMQFPVGKTLFSVAGRLAGFFQYPNTFAVFLLVCELLLLKKTGKRWCDYITLLVLVGGLLYTGSRTAFVVAILANIAMLFSASKKNIRKILFIGMAAVAVLAVLLMLGEDSVLRRYLTISLTESTFIGRLLYWEDALPLLLKYPFGMGYMGYYYVQQSIQTGVYSVAYIHNDFLQLVLDVGLIPSGLFVAALAGWFLKKSVLTADKIIVGAVCLHSFFDFNLQFIGMFFLLLLLLSQEKTDKMLHIKPKLPLKLGFATVVLVSLYMAAALVLAHFGERELSDRLYSHNTQNKLAMLEQAKDLEEANALSEEILEQNSYFYAPYSIKAKYFYSRGDFGQVIQNERAALERSPFLHSEYEAYCKMLITGIGLYQQAGDTQSATICQNELRSVAQRLSENKERLSRLGQMIDDQPIMELSDDIQQYIDKLGE